MCLLLPSHIDFMSAFSIYLFNFQLFQQLQCSALVSFPLGNKIFLIRLGCGGATPCSVGSDTTFGRKMIPLPGVAA